MMLVSSGKLNIPLKKTWPNFRITLQQEHKNLRLLQTAAGSLCYASNLTTYIPPESDTKDDTGVTDAILALDNVIQEENTSLHTTMSTLTETLKALQEQVTILSHGESNNSTNTRNNKNNKSYCWTHGRTRNPRHVSLNCRNKKTDIKTKLHYLIG